MLKASSELQANVVEETLGSSVEVGVEAALSHSHNDTSGQQLLTKHLGKHPSGLQLEQAYFKPIKMQMQMQSATDESKLGLDKRSAATGTAQLVKPTPVIFVNDSELQLSPMSPPPAFPHTASFPDPEEEVRRILISKLQVEEGSDSPSSSRCSSTGRSRRESINQLQKLQQYTKIPKLGGKVSSTNLSCN